MAATLDKEALETILNLVSSLTLEEALALLNRLSHDSYIIYEDDPYTKAMTFAQFIENYSGFALCSDTGLIWFYGGSPGKEKWICGYVSQFVADVVLHKIVEKGGDVVNKKLGAILSCGAP